jgi:hypothetical protein
VLHLCGCGSNADEYLDNFNLKIDDSTSIKVFIDNNESDVIEFLILTDDQNKLNRYKFKNGVIQTWEKRIGVYSSEIEYIKGLPENYFEYKNDTIYGQIMLFDVDTSFYSFQRGRTRFLDIRSDGTQLLRPSYFEAKRLIMDTLEIRISNDRNFFNQHGFEVTLYRLFLDDLDNEQIVVVDIELDSLSNDSIVKHKINVPLLSESKRIKVSGLYFNRGQPIHKSNDNRYVATALDTIIN